jgi:hypothetical protein
VSIHGICCDNGQSGNCNVDCGQFLDGACLWPEKFNSWLDEMTPDECDKTVEDYDLLKLYPEAFSQYVNDKTNTKPRIIELPLDINCVSHWTVEDAIRELLQNAIDQGEYKVTPINNKKRLWIVNENVTLPVKSLVIGQTTKNDGDIGGFGEGYKLAVVVLLRNGFGVKIVTGGEVWDFCFKPSITFNTSILNITIKPISKVKDTSRTTFIVYDLNEVGVSSVLPKLLMHKAKFFPHGKFITSSKGQVILNPDNPGDIYINGLYISNNSRFKYGYNFNPGVLHLDRDRKIIETYELSKITSSIWAEIAKNGGYGELIGELVYSEAYDVDSLGYHDIPPDLTDSIHKTFEANNGKQAVPYYFDSDKGRYNSEYNNLHPVYTPNNITNCIEKANTFKEKLAENELQEEDKTTPYNLLNRIYKLIRPFLTSDLQAAFMDIINKSKDWR